MLYEIHHRRNFDTPGDFVRIGAPNLDWRGRTTREQDPSLLGLDTLEKARSARCVSGDLVVRWGTTRVVPDEAWLWDWERADATSYAQKAIRHDNEGGR